MGGRGVRVTSPPGENPSNCTHPSGLGSKPAAMRIPVRSDKQEEACIRQQHAHAENLRRTGLEHLQGERHCRDAQSFTPTTARIRASGTRSGHHSEPCGIWGVARRHQWAGGPIEELGPLFAAAAQQCRDEHVLDSRQRFEQGRARLAFVWLVWCAPRPALECVVTRDVRGRACTRTLWHHHPLHYVYPSTRLPLGFHS